MRESANTDYKQGQAAEAREDYDTAFDDFQKAFKKDPKDTRFKIALARVRVTASSVHVTKGRKLARPATPRERWGSSSTPPRSTPATKPRSRRSPASARSKVKTRRCPRSGLPEPSRGSPGTGVHRVSAGAQAGLE